MSDKKASFWLVWNGSGSPTYKHESKLRAEAEAERLALLNRGVKFFVLQSISECVVDEVRVVQHERDDIPF